MGNSFIGFPVPRARIADMIAGAAPPLIHHTDHETGGDDEVDCTGLAGAGGVSLPFEDLYYHTYLDSLDGMEQITDGGASISLSTSFVTLTAAAAQWDKAIIKKEPYYPRITPVWSKNREFQTKAQMWMVTNSNGEIYIGTGDVEQNDGFGFAVIGGKLYGRSIAGGTPSNIELEDFGTSGFLEVRSLRAVLTAGSKIEYYVNGVLVGTETTTLPSDDSYAPLYLHAVAYNPLDCAATRLYLAEFQLWQEA